MPWLASEDGAEVLARTSQQRPRLEAALIDVIEYWRELLRSVARQQQCWVVF
jgi:hypothetical protein